MQCFENRRYAEKDCTIVYASSCWKTYHTHTAFSTGAAGQLSFKCKTGIQRSHWQANNLPTLSSTSHWTLHGRGSGCWACFSFFSVSFSFNQHEDSFYFTKSPHESFHFITYPTKPQRAGPLSAPIFQSMWLMDPETVISILTGCILFLVV